MNESHTCPICKETILTVAFDKNASIGVRCEQCGVYHHQQCWENNGGCNTIGCLGKYVPILDSRQQDHINLGETTFYGQIASEINNRPEQSINQRRYYLSERIILFGKRLFARVIDAVALFILAVIFAPLDKLFLALGASQVDANAYVGLFYIFLLLPFYDILFNWLVGKTPGKMAVKLELVTLEAQNISFWQAFGRFILTILISWFGIFLILFNTEGKALQDILSSTAVIDDKYRRTILFSDSLDR